MIITRKIVQRSILIFMIALVSCHQKYSGNNFSFKETPQGVEVSENGQPVFFYQKAPKSLDGRYVCSNYIHPLYSLCGDTLTEEFPADHPFHRGVFWAWHQMYIDGKSVGDGWLMTDLKQEVEKLEKIKKEAFVQLKIKAQWKSNLYETGLPFLAEETDIIVYPIQDNYRIIDFMIAIKALVPNVEIAGSDDEKGYGGFCCRIKNQADLTFTSSTGNVIAKRFQVKAGSWMDFSGPLGKNDEISGITLFCHPKTPNYPAPWILRNEASMQNIVFPGQALVPVSTTQPLILHYRMLIHDGNAKNIDFETARITYEKLDFQ